MPVEAATFRMQLLKRACHFFLWRCTLRTSSTNRQTLLSSSLSLNGTTLVTYGRSYKCSKHSTENQFLNIMRPVVTRKESVSVRACPCVGNTIPLYNEDTSALDVKIRFKKESYPSPFAAGTKQAECMMLH